MKSQDLNRKQVSIVVKSTKPTHSKQSKVEQKEKVLKIAVVTPYFKESIETLSRCHQSVIDQRITCRHYFIADGHPNAQVSGWDVEHVSLPKAHDDVGNTPRAIGCITAMNQGYDAIAFLDADNWYYPNHIETMVQLHQTTGAIVCTASRSIHRDDGSLMFNDTIDSDGRKHIDTSCFFILRPAFRILPLWAMMPKELGAAGDRVFWDAVKTNGLSHAHCTDVTVAFRTQYAYHYIVNREKPPPNLKSQEVVTALNWFSGLPYEIQKSWKSYFGSICGNVDKKAMNDKKRS